MKCPSCNIDLKLTERQGVEIDYCPQCRGVWLDRGELDKIIERSILSPESFRCAKEDEKDYQRYGLRNRQGKSFLGELFDFD